MGNHSAPIADAVVRVSIKNNIILGGNRLIINILLLDILLTPSIQKVNLIYMFAQALSRELSEGVTLDKRLGACLTPNLRQRYTIMRHSLMAWQDR